MNRLTATDFLERAQKHHNRLIEIRRTIHANPELAYEEHETSALARGVLEELGVETKSIAKTGVLGSLVGGSDGGCVALRADMDALPIHEETGLPFASQKPGVMHACGHDAHTAMALGAAMILSEIRESIPGTVKFLMQPSEELLPGGAPAMIAEGALEAPDVEAIFGQHVLPLREAGELGFMPGAMMASTDELYITITGKSGHAAIPHIAIDPIVTAAEIIVSLQKIVSRNLNPFDKGVVSITMVEGGHTTNVIPDEVKMRGTIRAMNQEWREYAHKRLEEIITGVCKANGAEYELEIRLGYPALWNDPTATEFAQSGAGELIGSEQVFQADPMMGAEDFAYYLQKIPGAFWWIGAGTPEQGCVAGLHNSRFTINEEILPVGAAMLAWTAYRYLVEK
ncbi:MAG: M20 family metallopeptidase [Candidatus Kapaibacterium sp.]